MLDRKFRNSELYTLQQSADNAATAAGGPTIEQRTVGPTAAPKDTNGTGGAGGTHSTEIDTAGDYDDFFKRLPGDAGARLYMKDGKVGYRTIPGKDRLGSLLGNARALQSFGDSISTGIVAAMKEGKADLASMLRAQYENFQQAMKWLDEITLSSTRFGAGMARLATQAFGGLSFQ